MAIRKEEMIRLQLYVSLGSPNSTTALHNLREICRLHLAGQYELEVVDLYEQPSRALTDGVLMTPMLVLASLDPPISIIGNLSDPGPLLRALEVAADDDTE